MKQALTISFMVCILSLAQMLAIASDHVIANAKMTRVELYRNGAQVYKQFSFTPADRISTVRVENIPTDTDPKTIRAKALGKEKIVSIHFETDYSISEKEKKNALSIKDSIEMVDLELSLLSAEIQSFEAQELMLNQNTRVLENNRGIDDLQKVLSLQRAELVTIKKSLVNLSYKQAKLQLKKTNLARKLQLSGNHNNPLAGIIVMEIAADPSQIHRIEVSYLSPDAWWTPVYDIRVESVDKPLELEYRAEVFQNTHEDWKDVQLLLFSNNPQNEGALGDLESWQLNYNSSAPVYAKREENRAPESQMSINESGISGTVTEEATGLPLPFANVSLKQNGRLISGAQTDFDGNFSIKGVSPGNYDIEISYVGFNTLKMNDLKLNPRNVSRLDIEMAASALALNEVVVAYKDPLIKQDAAQAQSIRSMPQRSRNEMAATVGGTYSRDNGSGSINVRGGRDDANYYYIDGIKVRGSSGVPSSYGDYPAQKRINTLFLNDQNQQEELRIEFEAPGKQNIPSSEKIKLVYLKSREVPAHYVYRAIPRIDNKVYLYAELSNWSDLGLLSGKTNLFCTNIFVGEAEINADQTDDTLAISLGPDRNIVLSSERTHQAENTPSFGSYSLMQEFKIELKSMKNYPVNIRLQDQIPVAMNDNYSVDLLEKNEGKLEEKTGIITWEFVLEPKEKATKTYKYLVKYPRGVRVAVN